MNADGSGQTNLTNNPSVMDIWPSLSLNGREIIYLTNANNQGVAFRQAHLALSSASDAIASKRNNPALPYVLFVYSLTHSLIHPSNNPLFPSPQSVTFITRQPNRYPLTYNRIYRTFVGKIVIANVVKQSRLLRPGRSQRPKRL
jgi:hypothetical protein